MAMTEVAKPTIQIQDVPPLGRAVILALPELEGSQFKPYLSQDFYTSTLSEAFPNEYRDNQDLIKRIYNFFNKNSSDARVRCLCTLLGKSTQDDLAQYSRSLVGDLLELSGLSDQNEFASRARQELMESPTNEKHLPAIWQLARLALPKIVTPPEQIH